MRPFLRIISIFFNLHLTLKGLLITLRLIILLCMLHLLLIVSCKIGLMLWMRIGVRMYFFARIFISMFKKVLNMFINIIY